MSRGGPSASDSRPNGRARRVLRALGLALLVLVAVVALGVLVLLRDLDARVRAILVDKAAELEVELGRRVTLGAVHVTLGTRAQVVVRDVVVEAAAGASGALARPPVVIASARVGVDLGLLVRSRGRLVVITRVAIEDAELSLVRTAEGLSIDDLRAKLAAVKPEPPGPPGKPPPVVVLEHLAVTRAKVRLGDVTTGAELLLDGVSLEGEGLRGDAPSHLTLHAALGAASPNVLVTLDLAPPPGGDTPALTRLEVHAADVRVAPVLAWLRAEAPALDLGAATLALDALVEPGEAMHVKGEARLSGARLAALGEGGARELGATAPVAVAVDAILNRVAGTLVARSFEVRIGAVTARGAVNARGLGAAPAIESGELDVTGEAAALFDVLPPSLRPKGLGLAGALAGSVRGGGDAKAARATAKVSVAALRLLAERAGVVEAGEPAAVGVSADLAYGAAEGTLRATNLALDVGAFGVKGELAVSMLGGARKLESFAMEARGPVEALLAALPPSGRPSGLSLKGAVTANVAAHVDGDAYAGRASLDLGHASVRGRGLAKPSGVPLALEVEGRVRAGAADIARSRLRAGPLSLTARGKLAGPEHVDLAFDADLPSVAALLSLFPAAAERFSGRTSVDGRVGVKGTLRRDGSKGALAATVKLASAELRRGLFSLRGDVGATLRASATAEGGSFEVDADLTAAALDIAALAHKPAGGAARVAFTASKAGDVLRVTGARVEIPGLALENVEVGVEPHALRVTVGPSSTLVMTHLMALATPLVRSRVPAWLDGATLRFGLQLAGDPEDLAAASLKLPSFALATRAGHVRGSASVDAVGKPRKVRVDVLAGDLTLPERDKGSGSDELAFDAPADVRVEGHVHLDTLRAGERVATGVDADVAFEEGRLRVASLSAGLLGGTVRLLPSFVDLSDVPELDLHARFEGLDLGAFPRGKLDELSGRLGASLDLHGRGATRQALTGSLRGEVGLAARDLHVKGAWEPTYRFTNQWLAAFAERRRAKSPPPRTRTVDLREVSAAFTLDRGKLTTKTPLVVRSDDLDARLEGAVGPDKALSLDGRIQFSARAVAERTGGALTPKGAVPLRLHVGGRLGAPQIELFDLADTLRALRSGGVFGTDPPPL